MRRRSVSLTLAATLVGGALLLVAIPPGPASRAGVAQAPCPRDHRTATDVRVTNIGGGTTTGGRSLLVTPGSFMSSVECPCLLRPLLLCQGLLSKFTHTFPGPGAV